jgi:predicted nucleotidyltransferase
VSGGIISHDDFARGDADEGSDIDVFLLVNTPREEIFRRNRLIGNVTGNLLLNYDVLVSPIVENREFYYQNIDVFPFFRNIQQEGVRVYA